MQYDVIRVLLLFTKQPSVSNNSKKSPTRVTVFSESDLWPVGCEFDTWFRRTFFRVFFLLSPLLRHVRKAVSGFGKKVVLVVVWESHETHMRFWLPCDMILAVKRNGLLLPQCYWCSVLLTGPYWKHLQTNQWNLSQIVGFVCESVENIVRKGENADHQHFLLFPQSFQVLSQGCINVRCLKKGTLQYEWFNPFPNYKV